VTRDRRPWYLVAQIDPDGKVTLGWTTEAYRDQNEALREMDDAHDAGMTDHRVWDLRDRTLRLLPPPQE
jgi:hypothetical protein